jgi:hypothetical protein
MLKNLMTIILNLLALAAFCTSVVWAQGETLPRGEGVVSVFYVRSNTAKHFDFLGQRTRIIPPAGADFRGTAETNLVSLDVAYGLTNRLEVHVTVPYAQSKVTSLDQQGQVLNNANQSPSNRGLSNVRFGVRYNFVSEPYFLTAKFDVKTAASTPDPERLFNGTSLPIQEGQTDFDLVGEFSKSFTVANRGLRIGGEAGIRLRRTQKDGALDTFTIEKLPVSPANEFIYGFRVSYGLWPRVSVSLAGDGLRQGNYDVPFRFTRVGENGEVKTVGTQGNLPPGFQPDFPQQTGRRIFSLGPLANVNLTSRLAITGGVLFTVAGRNYPAGQFWVLGVSRFF